MIFFRQLDHIGLDHAELAGHDSIQAEAVEDCVRHDEVVAGAAEERHSPGAAAELAMDNRLAALADIPEVVVGTLADHSP